MEEDEPVVLRKRIKKPLLQIVSSDATSVAQQDQGKIIINVGGKRHESYLSTLRNIPDTRLSWLAENIMNKQEHQAKKEIFFDRHPDLFAIILNYYRTGKLHAPRAVCGPLFEEELCFWGIEEMEMEACCWPNYAQHRDAEENLKDFVGPEFEDEEVDLDTSNITYGDEGTLWQRYQPRVWAILDDAFSSRKAKLFAMFSLSMILLSIMFMCAGSLAAARNHYSINLFIVYGEYAFCVWFTLELLIRIIFCPSKFHFVKQVMTWIDIISLIPYYYKFFSGQNSFDFLRSIRLIRLFRAFRFFRFTSGLQIIVQSLKASLRELFLLAVILLIPVVMFSSAMYDLEKEQGDNTVNFTSIPQSFWWAIITITTVGYGDMSPRTLSGQIIGSLCAICGVLIIGLPVSVIGNNFSTYYEHAQARLNLPKKKRRIIMGDANRLMFLNSPGSCGGNGFSESINVPISEDFADINDNQEFQPDRRYHRHSRNILFSRSNSTRRNKEDFDEKCLSERGSREGMAQPWEDARVAVENLKNEENPHSGLRDSFLLNDRWGAARRLRHSNSFRLKSKSPMDQEVLAKRPTSPRPGSRHSFRLREDPGKSLHRAGSTRSVRGTNPASLIVPSISTSTHLRAPEDQSKVFNANDKRHSDQGIRVTHEGTKKHNRESVGKPRTRDST